MGRSNFDFQEIIVYIYLHNDGHLYVCEKFVLRPGHKTLLDTQNIKTPNSKD